MNPQQTTICINYYARYVLIWRNGRQTSSQFWIARWSWWRLLRVLDNAQWRLVGVDGDEHWFQGGVK